MDDVIFSEDYQICKVQYLRNYAIKMHRVNVKKFQKFFSKDLFYKINNDSDFIAPLNFLYASRDSQKGCSGFVENDFSRI